MKKILFMLLAVMGVFSSCSNKVDDLYNPDMTAALKNAQYNRAFLSQFGNIDPNHTWGFNNLGARVAITNANEWASYVDVPSPLTKEEKELVTNWFANNQNPVSTPVQWSEYFAQQVSSTEYAQKMSYLTDGDGTHLNNFNGGDQGSNGQVWSGELTDPNDQNSKVFHEDKILFVRGGSTTSYSCLITCDNNRKCNDFVIVPGELIDSSLAGKFYLGFDFSAQNYDGKGAIAADGYYNDWIIKLTPCNYTKSYRVIAEDLGEIGDFDFNDVVFDVYFYKIGYRDESTNWQYVEENNAAITLRAAGGTLPLYICHAGKSYEVHQLFGVEQDVMVNTDANGVQKPVAIFTLNNCTPLDEISIKVKQDNGEIITLTAEQGKAPSMICVDASFEWPAERQNIKDKYPEFVNYVNNQTITWY